MKNTTPFNAVEAVNIPGRLPIADVLEQEPQKRRAGLVSWWYQTTSPPELNAHASFVKRESARRAHLLSSVVFFLIASLVLMMPAAFFLPTTLVIYVVLAMIAMAALSLVFNRAGKTLLAGIVVLCSFEMGLIAGAWAVTPLDVVHLPTFDLFIMGELLAVSLLPARNVFLVAIFNIIFLWLDLRYQPLTPLFTSELHAQFYAVLLRPVALQVIVAGVAYLWARSAAVAIARADRAEMIAILEHTLTTQKSDLELGIQQILHTHAQVAQGDLAARAPLNKDNLLWQIASSLNTFLARYQRAQHAQQELNYIVAAISSLSGMMQEATQKQRYLQLPLTRTSLDPLIVSFNGMLLALNKYASAHVPLHAGRAAEKPPVSAPGTPVSARVNVEYPMGKSAPTAPNTPSPLN